MARIELPTLQDVIDVRAMHWSRRPGARMNRGRVPATKGGPGAAPPAPSVFPPTTIISSVPFDFYLPASSYDPGTGTWADQSSGGNSPAQATAGQRPALEATGAPNSTPCVTATAASSHTLVFPSFIPGSPLTTPRWFCAVLRANTPASGTYLFGGNATNRFTWRWIAGPIAQMNVAAATNVAAVDATWVVVQAYFSGSASDFNRFGSTQTNGMAGSTAVTAGTLALFALNTGASFGNFSLAAIMCTRGLPNGTELANLISQWVTPTYGSLPS